jgi:hypothetical protein
METPAPTCSTPILNTSSFGDIASATGNRTIQFAPKRQF